MFSICNGIVSDMADSMGGISEAMVSLPAEMQTAIENVGFLASIPLWLVTILGSLFITVLSFVMILTVYGRFFRLYMYTALAPLPLAAFAGESAQSVGISFLKSYVGVCLEGAVIVLACVIYSAFVSTPTVDQRRGDHYCVELSCGNQFSICSYWLALSKALTELSMK